MSADTERPEEPAHWYVRIKTGKPTTVKGKHITKHMAQLMRNDVMVHELPAHAADRLEAFAFAQNAKRAPMPAAPVATVLDGFDPKSPYRGKQK